MKYKLLIIFLLVGFYAVGQNSVNPEPEKTTPTVHNAYASTNKAKAQVKVAHPYDWYFDQKVEEYEERMKAKAKEYKKLAKLIEKPQYSDPAYFGHKHKPKKRPPGKRKYCDECGMVH
ncbi:MAG: hypothetical protein KDC79_02710 [Cyclobacteriaceae bacterium]|nr:hypothetical protein [Cyclobacteriaceae bacterium]